MARGYTTNTDVASYLGRTFTAAENTLATRLLGAAEEWVDEKTGKAYKVNAQRTEYFFDFPGPLITLQGRPIVSIDSVALVSSYGEAEAAEPNTEYSIRDADKGLIFLGTLQGNVENYFSARVTYTVGNTIPERVKLATEMLIAHWMRPALMDEAIGVANFSVGSEENISYTELVKEYGVPAEVWSVLGVSPGGSFFFV